MSFGVVMVDVVCVCPDGECGVCVCVLDGECVACLIVILMVSVWCVLWVGVTVESLVFVNQ